MLLIKNLLRLTAVLAAVSIFIVGCETIKGAQKDVQKIVTAAKSETEEPRSLGIAVDKVMKIDNWIKDNMW